MSHEVSQTACGNDVSHRQKAEERRSLILCILFVSSVWAVNAYLLLRSQTVFINNMPVDVLHAILGAERIRLGDVPHADFHTPVGALRLLSDHLAR